MRKKGKRRFVSVNFDGHTHIIRWSEDVSLREVQMAIAEKEVKRDLPTVGALAMSVLAEGACAL